MEDYFRSFELYKCDIGMFEPIHDHYFDYLHDLKENVSQLVWNVVVMLYKKDYFLI